MQISIGVPFAARPRLALISLRIVVGWNDAFAVPKVHPLDPGTDFIKPSAGILVGFRHCA
jgi:hypothetical protein